MKAKIGILSLGCPRNLVDSEKLLGRLDLKGYSVVDIEKADVALINTCAFIEEAKKESIAAILDLVELKKAGRLKKIIVYGCLAQRYKDVLRKELPEVDAFIGKVSLNYSLKRFPITPKHFAYLKICEGCLNACSFCVIPRIKGEFISLPISSIISEVEKFNREKISELNIIGQDITGYGLDLGGKTDLASLISRIVKIAKDIHWIRLLYLHPGRITDGLLTVIKNEPKICKYIDLPVQHINDRMLKLMNRKTVKKEIMKVIERIRKAIPGVALRTSIIVGFPGETDKEFQELLDFVKGTRFERLGAFTFSAEEGTPAYSFNRQVPKKVKSQRLDLIMSAQQEIATEFNRKFLGKSLEVLIDEEDNGTYLGRTQFDAPEVDGLVYIKSKRKLEPGDFVKVKISDTLEYDLVGEVK
ncbi:MAG: MiaB/RimO family radical SAM methylthiotransferase [Candidatus Omnitrophota bacterium]|nr:MiaB/RimO family radical SAM methylthiotransferase [Candidatus Omnitrophota bacterium]